MRIGGCKVFGYRDFKNEKATGIEDHRTGNKVTYETMRDDIDFDASPIIHGTELIDDLAEKLMEMVIRTAIGRRTKAEILGYGEFAVMRACNYV